ncbi:MAG: GGDEF domain-containing protein, partial [Desulfovibrionales bacterium]
KSNSKQKIDPGAVREIERLCRAMEEMHPSGRPEGTLAVFRLFQGVDPDQWQQLADKFGLENWLALPLEENRYADAARLQARIDKLVNQSKLDSLTGLHNRRAFHENLLIEIERSRRMKSPMSLAILDVDDFKSVNDSHGHLCGDVVLKELAATIRRHIRKLDFAARLGGEEFAIILTGSGLVQSQKVLERLRKKINELEVRCNETSVSVTPSCSMGLACYKGSAPINLNDIVHEADKALYRAKEMGKNRIVSALLLGLAVSDTTLVGKEEKKFLFSDDSSS